MKVIQHIVLLFAVCAGSVFADVIQTPLFVSGQDGYNTYRIPAVAVTNSGAVLAFCEGRNDGGGDSGNIDMLLKRSTDNGKTWSTQQDETITFSTFALDDIRE